MPLDIFSAAFTSAVIGGGEYQFGFFFNYLIYLFN